MSTNRSDLWAGAFDDGEVVVFDPQAQRPNEVGWIYLWSKQTLRTERYAEDIVKKAMRSIDSGRASTVIADYVAHRDRPKKQADEKAAFKHRELFERLGLKYLGTRTARPHGSRSVRVTHCWNCKRDLDNRVQLECKACAWILCGCGACGCGRS